MAELLLDLSLALLLLASAWGALFAARLGASIGLFVAFGLLLSLIWARLGSADLALAEAAIGAGLTGVLLLRAARGKTLQRQKQELQQGSQRKTGSISSLDTGHFASVVLAVGYLLLLSGILAVSIVSDAENPLMQQALVPELAAARLDSSGVTHPVTAVLLNFRAWDTLLELLVLMLALLGARQLYPAIRTGHLPPPEGEYQVQEAWALMLAWTRLLAPLLILIGGYILWRGSSSPGGAFQGGALLAAALVLMRLTGALPTIPWSSFALRFFLCMGVLLFLGLAAGFAVFGAGWLVYPDGMAYGLILMIELLATLSIAATLAMLVIGAQEDFRR